ncbi:unnamed protein product [Prorocentrum cordatum]|uniref:Uncharacterized protein n=1 Tax=Prorocentrum cordatum TaxID=2364126 RepID=A0ABN9TLY2_9DINO|nr:unnamed protein product [Polarella glacialis]
MLHRTTGSVKYLGRMVDLDRPRDVEINNRIHNEMACFMKCRAELIGRQYSTHSRLRLFDSTVTTTMLHVAAAWVLTRELEDNIRRTQRRLLRMIALVSRRRARGQPFHFDVFFIQLFVFIGLLFFFSGHLRTMGRLHCSCDALTLLMRNKSFLTWDFGVGWLNIAKPPHQCQNVGARKEQ